MWQLLGAGLAAVGTGVSIYENDRATKSIDQGIQEGTAAVQSTDANIASQAATTAANGGTGPGAAYLRTMIADPGTLTAAQRSQLQDLRTSTANQLHGSDFAGNGRTAVAVFKKTEDDFTNDALASNKQQATGAANTLANASTAAQGQEFSAMQAGANASLAGAEGIGNANAANDVATGKLIGQALGDVGSSANKASKLQAMT